MEKEMSLRVNNLGAWCLLIFAVPLLIGVAWIDEATALCENCFITVTAFFREPAVFEELKNTVFPALVANRAADATSCAE